MKLFLLCLLLTLGGTLVLSNAAADIRISEKDEQKARQKTSELTWADENDLARKAQAVELLGQRHFGQSLRHDTSDLVLLQRIADRKLIRESDVDNLQALGVVLGNTLQQELAMEWKVYTDDKGRSRALCVPGTEYCLFPVTMLSRRLEVGLPVNVETIYNDAVATINPYLPDRHAYDGVKPDPRPKSSWLGNRPQSRPPIKIRVE